MQGVSISQAPLILTISANNTLVFVPGQIITARVVSAGPGGLVSLALAGQIIEAYSQIDLEPEQQIRLLVQSSSDGRIQLKLLTDTIQPVKTNNLENLLSSLGLPVTDKTRGIINQLRALQLPITKQNITDLARLNNLWQSPAPLGPLLQQIAADLDKYLPTSSDQDNLTNLKDLLEQFKNEAAVRPNRPAPEIAGQLNRQVAATPAFQTLLNMIARQLPMKDGLQQAVEILTAQQLLVAAEPSAIGEPAFYGWQFPLVIPGQLEQVTVAIRREAGPSDQPDSRSIQVIINLDTPSLGPQSYDLRFRDVDVGISVTVTNEDSREIVNAYWPELAAALAGLGYQAVLTNCIVGQVPAISFNPGAPASFADWRRVDIKI